MPIVLSTVGVEYGLSGHTLPSILSGLDGIEPIDGPLPSEDNRPRGPAWGVPRGPGGGGCDVVFKPRGHWHAFWNAGMNSCTS